MRDRDEFADIETAEEAIESGGFLIRNSDKEPNYDYGALREYAKKHNKKYCEMSREELNQFHLPN